MLLWALVGPVGGPGVAVGWCSDDGSDEMVCEWSDDVDSERLVSDDVNECAVLVND